MTQNDSQQEEMDQFAQWAASIGMDDDTIHAILELGWDDPLYNHAEIREIHETNRLLVNGSKLGCVVVGDCPGANGDVIAVSLIEDIGSVWYISHKRIPADALQEIGIRVGDKLYDTFDDICDDDDFPGDYYSAKEYFEELDE